MKFAEQLGFAVSGAGGENEIRAQYGGFFFAAAAACAAAFAGAIHRRHAFFLAAVIFGGLVLGRVVSLLLNGGVVGYGPMIIALHFIDSAGFALSLIAFVLDRRARPQLQL